MIQGFTKDLVALLADARNVTHLFLTQKAQFVLFTLLKFLKGIIYHPPDIFSSLGIVLRLAFFREYGKHTVYIDKRVELILKCNYIISNIIRIKPLLRF